MLKFKNYINEEAPGKMLITEASFRAADLKKVCKAYAALFSKGLGGTLRYWCTETFERDGEAGQGCRMANANGHMLRFNFSDQIKGFANNNAIVLSSVDYWKPGNADLECPDVTCKFLKEVNVVQIWKKLSSVLFNGKFGKYTAADLGAPMNEDIETVGSVKARKDFLASKGLPAWRGMSPDNFRNTVTQNGLESEWNTYIATVTPGRSESNSTEARMQRAEALLDKTPYADPNVIFDDIVTLTKHMTKSKMKLLSIFGMGGLGKCVDVDTLVATPNGPVRAGDIKTGDSVFTADGKPANVVEVYPQDNLSECYRITLSDGRSVVADEGQLFNVKMNSLKSDSNAGKFENKPLSEIVSAFNEQKNQLIAKGEWNKPNAKKTHIFFNVPDTVQYAHKDVAIDPYFLGLLLGDGGITEGVTFSNADEGTIEWVKKHLGERYAGYVLKHRGGVDYSIVRENYNAEGKTIDENRNAVKSDLAALGLMGAKSADKFIPDIYKFNDVETRMELVRGLMDADGYIGKSGNTSLCSASERLASDFTEIVRSLGGTAKISVKSINYKGAIKHYFNVDFVLPFKMGSVVKNNALKVERYSNRLSKREFFKKLTVADIEPVGLRETVCFRIDDPDHLFLTADYMIVHNTYEVRQTLKTVLGPEPSKKWVYIPAGKFSTRKFFEEVFNARDKIICFDEADNIITNDEIVTMLKPALDTTGDNQMTYNTGTKPMSDMSKDEVEDYSDLCDGYIHNEGLQFMFGRKFGKSENVAGTNNFDEDEDATGVWAPSRFFFTGKMIFISNLSKDKIDSALLTRGPKIDVNLSLQGKLVRIETVLKKQGRPQEEIDELMSKLKKRSDPEHVSLRTVMSYLDFVADDDIPAQDAMRIAANYG